jgi:hypothetical protein
MCITRYCTVITQIPALQIKDLIFTYKLKKKTTCKGEIPSLYHQSSVKVKVLLYILQISAGSFITGLVNGFLDLCKSAHGTNYRESWFGSSA